MRLIVSSLLCLILFVSIAQTNTVGLIHKTEGVAEGYTFFSPERNNKSYLISNCGEIVNEWTFSQRPGLTAYILENGNVLYAGKDSVEIRDWNSNLIWSIAINETFGFNQHHDIEPLPNGNILLVVADNYDSTIMFTQGLDTSFLSATFRLDKIVEIEPAGFSGANIVWEWKFYDHLIQDIDSTKPNYGQINNHPELLDMNFEAENESDFTHVNAVDYNAALDQILISARNINEIYIIDHSTTTVEAASHSGGSSGKGGDFLWRWGNPMAYNSGFGLGNKKLGRQHDCKWIDSGTHKDKISVFSNASVMNVGFSEVFIINPDFQNNAYTMQNNCFLPHSEDWSWFGSILGETMNVSIKSGVQILPNNNALIVETTKGRFSEIDSLGNVVWVYEVPHGTEVVSQFDAPLNNGAFRATKYPMDYVGFLGKDLTPSFTIEDQNYLSDSCKSIRLDIQDVGIKESVVVYPNPVVDMLTITSKTPIKSTKVYNVFNQLIWEGEGKNISFLDLNKGIYFLEIETDYAKTIKKVLKI